MNAARVKPHTPGPWEIDDGNVYAAHQHKIVTLSTGEQHREGLIALVYQDHEYASDGANSRLIAAAPDMLSHLQAFVIDHTGRPGVENINPCGCLTCGLLRRIEEGK